MKNNANLYALLASGFPADRSQIAIETHDGLFYRWSDLEGGSARIAGLLASLGLERGARVAVQVEKSPECLMLYLA
ncbi:MAG: malonyl-CoA synthase, partial [Burkholderiaceae bacterium]